ncbi:Clumping factor ClfA, fibrinogen-binding protein [Staphylococcus aureus]|uniref:Clumping factor ClfA, fibrinogen-binding protein n=1 Tax=Staphylococcus aureus TaxID=1280 RepID=A0A2X2JTC2_STAAU|nr:Clumping factor ClfA, fibrinogen-binding protein [Staphylococcus aureus]
MATGIGSTTANKTVLVDYEKYGKFYNLSIKGTIDQSIKQIIRIVRQFMSIQVEITLLRRF